MRSWTIRPKFTNLIAASALLLTLVPAAAPATLQTDPQALQRTMRAAYARGAADGWHFADEVYYFSTVLDAGRAFALVRRDDPNNRVLEGYALELARKLNYDPLVNRDAAEWYVRLAASTLGDAALVARLDAEDQSSAQLARDADADAAANVAAFPNDAEALLEQVDADLRAYSITGDSQYRSRALLHAAQPTFPVAVVPAETARPLFAVAQAAERGEAGYDETDRAAAHALLSHRVSTKGIPIIGHVLSHQAYLVITAPADEYFGNEKLSPIGVRNELTRIGKYLDAGWGTRMTSDTLEVLDSLQDWEHQYPRDYELPRLLLLEYHTLARIDSPQAQKAEAEVRRNLTVDYNASPEARSLLALY